MLVTTLTKKEQTMAKKNDTAFFENKLLDFVTAKDPMLEMLQWVMDKFMEIEVAHKTGAEKGIYTTNAIESLNFSLRKVTQNKLSFPDDDSIYKVMYLVIKNASADARWLLKTGLWQ